jgi:hypothetical protein
VSGKYLVETTKDISMSLKLSEIPPKTLAECRQGQRMFLEELFYPYVRAVGLPIINYHVSIYDSKDSVDGRLHLSPLYLLSERKELRKWWALTAPEVTKREHRQLMRLAMDGLRQAVMTEKAFRARFSFLDLDDYRSSTAWKCFPTWELLRTEATAGIWELQASCTTAERIIDAHRAPLRLEDWAG